MAIRGKTTPYPTELLTVSTKLDDGTWETRTYPPAPPPAQEVRPVVIYGTTSYMIFQEGPNGWEPWVAPETSESSASTTAEDSVSTAENSVSTAEDSVSTAEDSVSTPSATDSTPGATTEETVPSIGVTTSTPAATTSYAASLPTSTAHKTTTTSPLLTSMTSTPSPAPVASVSGVGSFVTVTAKPESTKELALGAIVGLVIGALAFIGIAGLVAWFCLRHRRANRSQSHPQSTPASPASPRARWRDSLHGREDDGDDFPSLSSTTRGARQSVPVTSGDKAAAPAFEKRSSEPTPLSIPDPSSPSAASTSLPTWASASGPRNHVEQTPIIEHDRDVGRMRVLLPPAYDPTWKLEESDVGSSGPAGASSSSSTWSGRPDSMRWR